MNTVVSPDLLAFLVAQPGRCTECGLHIDHMGHRPTCSRANDGERLAVEGMDRAVAANPADADVVDRAIAEACRAGREFSANDFRHLCDRISQPNVIGARIRAWSTSKRITRVGDTPSTLPGTHAHRIGTYRPT